MFTRQRVRRIFYDDHALQWHELVPVLGRFARCIVLACEIRFFGVGPGFGRVMVESFVISVEVRGSDLGHSVQ